MSFVCNGVSQGSMTTSGYLLSSWDISVSKVTRQNCQGSVPAVVSRLTALQPASFPVGNAVHSVRPSSTSVWCFQYLSTPPRCAVRSNSAFLHFIYVLTFFCFRPALGPTQPPIQWVPGLYWGVKWTGCGIDHPPLSRAEVKEMVELYLCSNFGPSWPVLGWALPLPLPFFCFGSSFLRGLNNSVLRWKNRDVQLTTHLRVMSK